MTITLTREEARQVLDALADAAGCVQENYQPGHIGHGWGKEIETLRARLAQPEPPCKTGSQCIGGKCPQCVVSEWQGLTDDEIMSLLPGAVRLPPGWVDTVRAIEDKLKEKNT